MSAITLIFPDQLFQHHPAISDGRAIYLVEEFLHFKVQPFHMQRLVLLKAAMEAYANKLKNEKKTVVYISSQELEGRGDVFKILAKAQIKHIHLAEFADDWLAQDLMAAAEKFDWKIHSYPSPGFICSNKEIKDFFKGKHQYSMAQFYAYQRKKLDILMDGPLPVGGKFSFDTENRKKIPKHLIILPPFNLKSDTHLKELIDQVKRDFPSAIGESHPFLYPYTHEQARSALQNFLNHKLSHFGDYQDAIQVEDSFLFHSVLSPTLNIGLLTPQEIIDATMIHANNNRIPLNSLEGFIRQIIGWREYVRASYYLNGGRQRSKNFFSHHHKIPASFYKGSTGILPIDRLIQSILRTGYCNHIERLMVLGNFLLLTESSPQDIYHWFMGYFVDAYDWVMVPNIYGMSQYADGGKIVTKPYISGSNYLLKMSNYPKGIWTDIWDGLFWRFMHIHSPLFSSNPRTSALMTLFKKNEKAIFPKMQKAEEWLKEYRKSSI